MTRNSKIVLTVVIGLILLSITSVVLIVRFLQLPMYVDREVSANVRVTTDWTTITPDTPMTTKRRFQAVTLVIDGVKHENHQEGLILEDGSVVYPKIEISDMQDRWYPLKGGSYTIKNYDTETDTFDVVSADFKGMPEDVEFESIRIRSNSPFVAKKIIWRNYNLK